MLAFAKTKSRQLVSDIIILINFANQSSRSENIITDTIPRISSEQKLTSIALCKISRLPDILVNFFIRFGKIFPQRIVWGAKIREKLLKFIVYISVVIQDKNEEKEKASSFNPFGSKTCFNQSLKLN